MASYRKTPKILYKQVRMQPIAQIRKEAKTANKKYIGEQVSLYSKTAGSKQVVGGTGEEFKDKYESRFASLNINQEK